jgi:UDP-N-acetylmuramoyl-tripeptide--D-alanyl-D-alanine ligase
MSVLTVVDVVETLSDVRPQRAAQVIAESEVKARKVFPNWRRKRAEATAIEVIGSTRKTTSEDLIADVLGWRFCTLKNSGDLYSTVDVTLSLLWLIDGHQQVVLEIEIPGGGII